VSIATGRNTVDNKDEEIAALRTELRRTKNRLGGALSKLAKISKPEPSAIQIDEHRELFKFEVESHVLGKTVTGIRVTKDRVELNLGDTGIGFEVRGDDIAVLIAKKIVRGDTEVTVQ
jgi:hypothetical protein